jgi:multiple sugar transport system substrate-binding protein
MRVSRPRIRLLAAVTLTMALAAGGATACGGSSDSSSGSTLQMWTFKQAHVKPLQDAAARFKAQTGISVDVTAYTPDDAYKSKIQSAAQTKNVADVLEVHAVGEDFVLGGSGILADLAPSVNDAWKARFVHGTADSEVVSNDRYQRSLKPKAPDVGIQVGQMFSVPFTIGAFGIVYANKAKLTAAGLDPANPPKTWAQFVSWLKATNTKDPQAGGLTVGLKSSTTGFNWLLEPLAYAYLGKAKYQALFAKDPASAFGSPDGQRVLELYNQLTPYWTPGTQTLSIDDADRAFAQGKSAFDLGGTFTLAAIGQNGLKADDVVSFSLPAAEGGASADLKLAPIPLTGLSISAQSKKQDDAVKWLDFLTKSDEAGKFAQGSLDLTGTDLGADSAKLLGPNLFALQKTLGEASQGAYDASFTDIFSPAYVDTDAADVLVKMSPLKETTPAATNQALGALVANSWK